MTYFHTAWLEHQRKRYLRADAYRFAAPGTPEAKPAGWLDPSMTRVRWKEAREAEARAKAQAAQEEFEREVLALRHDLAKLKLEYELRRFQEKYSRSQPRVPAGNPQGGQWTSGSSGTGRNDPIVVSDATPANEAVPGAQYAQGRRGTIAVRIGGRVVQVEGGQAARLVEAQARADETIARVRELDPKWRPTPSAYESVEGLIGSYRAEAQEAQAPASELAKVGIGPGPFAGESISARGPARSFTAEEHREINRIGNETGCHTCSTKSPGTPLGNFVVDHQPPSALNSMNRSQQLYPQCLTCSLRQGGWITGRRTGR